MTKPTLTSSHLQLLLNLTRKREAIAADLEQIEKRISGLFGNHETQPKPATTRKGRPPGRKAKGSPAKRSNTRVPRGTLKEKVLAALKAAGREGLAVRDVAEKIGAKKTAVNVWFYTTGKKVAGLKKIAPGRFALKS